MEETQAYTGAAAEGLPIGLALILGTLAMVLIYIVTASLPKIAAKVDKLLGRDPAENGKKQDDIPNDDAEPSPARVGDNYKAYDIYEGEMNLDDYNDDDKKE